MADSEDKLTDEQLKERWETPEGQAFRAEIIRQLQSDETEHAVDWENLKIVVDGEEKLWRDFPGVSEKYDQIHFGIKIYLMLHDAISEKNGKKEKISFTELRNARFGDLRFINIDHIDIPKAVLSLTTLQNASLKWANIQDAVLDKANLQNANLYSANLQNTICSYANIESAELAYSDFQKANLHFANLRNAILVFADFQQADLNNAFLESTTLNDCNLHRANLTNAIFCLKTFWWRIGLWSLLRKLGVKLSNFCPTLLKGADLSGIKLGSSPTMHRKLLDEVYLEDFAEHHPVYYQLWLWTSNCGRSPVLVGFWALLIGVFFGAAFSYYPYWGPDWGWLQGIFVIDKPMFEFDGPEWWRPYYHSFTTLTTLGWASANPNSEAGFWWHTWENITGYVMLGYLIAVIGDLLTRRSN